ncbi:MAG: hypothetical protein J6D16_01830 [Clostridia bacterium]|nr:hypothetical protein [Clostridia bacterium]
MTENQQKYLNYKEQFKRLNHAIANGFHLEAMRDCFPIELPPIAEHWNESTSRKTYNKQKTYKRSEFRSFCFSTLTPEAFKA